MSITSQKKKSLISTYAIKEDDTGSSFVQCAILTERISNLTEHFKAHKHDQILLRLKHFLQRAL